MGYFSLGPNPLQLGNGVAQQQGVGRSICIHLGPLLTSLTGKDFADEILKIFKVKIVQTILETLHRTNILIINNAAQKLNTTIPTSHLA
jgi:hypothetical protein